MNEHLWAAVKGGIGGIAMGGIVGVMAFTVLAAASLVAATTGGFLAVAALPMLAMGYRESKEYYLNSIQHARPAVDPKIMEKLNNPPPPIQAQAPAPDLAPETKFAQQETARRMAGAAKQQNAPAGAYR